MFVTTPEIVWHNKEPVFSIDFHHNGGMCRLASAGSDFSVKLWRVVGGDERMQVVFVASLERHSKSVNAVRFSPDGKLLASAGDDCVICVWKQCDGLDNGGNILALDNDPAGDGHKENWNVTKMLRGHIEDVYDLCWSSDNRQLISGSVDNSAIVWDVVTGDKLSILKESQHYIQGVAWASHGGCLATLGTDRTLRIYNDKLKCIHSITKWSMSDEDKPKRLFHDETMSSFFRRLAFSPDGLLLVAPGGIADGADVTWIFTTSSLPKPVMYLGGCTKPSIVVRFSPVLYQLKTTPTQQDRLFDLPYCMVFAIGTIDTLLIYNTQETTPIAIITDIHYTSLTDLTWSDNGLVLMTSSTDGYCTIVRLTEEELGVVYNGTALSVTPPTKGVSSPPTPTTTPVTTPTTNKTAPRRVNFVTLSNNGLID